MLVHLHSWVMVLLLLYANDLILMSESAAEGQRQLDALARYCEERQLKVNLSKTRWQSLSIDKVTCQSLCLMVQLWRQ